MCLFLLPNSCSLCLSSSLSFFFLHFQKKSQFPSFSNTGVVRVHSPKLWWWKGSGAHPSITHQHTPLSPLCTFLSRRKLLTRQAGGCHCSGGESRGVIKTEKEKNSNTKMEIVSSELANSVDTVCLSEM